jgi:hypothetical protein
MKRLKKIFENANEGILGAGALAVAIGTIVVLINQLTSPPTPPAKRNARFDHIEGPREITLAEYEADSGLRAGAAYRPDPTEWLRQAAYRLLAYTNSSPPTAKPNVTILESRTPMPPAESTTTSTASTTSTTATETTPAHILPPVSTTTGTSTTPGPGEGTYYLYKRTTLPRDAYRAHNAIIQEGNGTSPRKVSEALADSFGESGSHESEGGATSTSTESQTGTFSATTPTAEASPPPPPSAHRVVLPRKCTRCALLPILESALADSHEDPEAAGRELRAAEREWRERNRDGDPQLVGVEVDYRLDLKGFAGKKVIVKYTIVKAGPHLSPDWWGLRVADKGTEPKEPEASIPEKLWALIPQAPGTYYLHLELYSSEGKELEYADTHTFH